MLDYCRVRIVMDQSKKNEKTKYFIERFLQMLRSNGDIEFNSLPICGFLELSRQYVSMPPGVRELSAEYIKGSIVQNIEHSSLLFKYSAHIPIKEIKPLVTALTLIKELKTIRYIPNLYDVLSDYNSYIGLIRTVKYVLDKGISGAGKDIDEYSLIDELISLIVEYLEHRGNSITEVYAICNNWFRQDPMNTEKVFGQIITHLRNIGNPNNDKLITVRCSLTLISANLSSSNINSFVRKIIKQYEEQNKISSVSSRRNGDKLTFYFSLIRLDGLYIDRVLGDISERVTAYKERTKEQLQFKIMKDRRPYELINNRQTETYRIKHFDNLWKTTDFTNVNDYVCDEMFRLNEWIEILNQSNDKRTSFLILWSIIEFMMVHSIDENKIESVCRNFTPYMGLFYFRKVSKTFFKKMIALHSENNRESSRIIISHISSNLNTLNIDISKLSVADQSCLFLFYKEFKDKWWDNVTFSYASNEFINRQTNRTYNLVQNASKSLSQLEHILNNDIKQMYRLRNMLTHSGVNDSKILDSTYIRLKYYVETIINAISYSWLHDSTKPKTLIEINDHKRVDYNLFKSNLKSILSTANNHNKPLELLKIMKYKGTTAIPPNRFSFLGELEKDID